MLRRRTRANPGANAPPSDAAPARPRKRRPLAESLPAIAAPDGNVSWLSVLGARHNNLKGVDVHFPLGRFIAVTGVSGSGKSSLVNDILRDALLRDLNGAATNPGAHRGIVGFDQLDKIVDIDQSPIGRTPRSNPATYVKVFDQIRDLYTKLPEAKARGYPPGRFSFNVVGGRCEACSGNGSNRLEMEFLADVWVTCPVCEGRRFNRETLQIRFKDKSIHDVLEMDIQEALEHFGAVPDIHRMLKTLHDVGLDYIKLGQPSPTLSGGEAQRIKLAKELCRKSTGRTLYVLDEPTTGLHFADIKKLLEVLHGFVNSGNTVIVIEHNLDVVKTADWVIDLGPEGGEAGGQVVFAGSPEGILQCAASHTGQALKLALAPAAVSSPKKSRRSSAVIPAGKPMTHLEVDGARQHNLKDVTARFPLHKMTVFSGPSGSGKTSLAIDTLYAEGQRRYVESLSSYARQFLGQLQKPAVERVAGLSPAISIEQKTASKSPRSTVGTVTEIHDYFRVLMARLGEPRCPDCQLPIGTQTSDEIIDRLMTLADGAKVYLLAPLRLDDYNDFASMWQEIQRSGFLRARVDGVTCEVANPPSLDRKRRHAVEVVVDRAVIRHNQRSRIADSVEAALDLGRGVMHVAHVDDKVGEKKWKIDRYSQHFSCDRCGRGFPELTPNMFSFNSSVGWCDACEGLGVQAGGGGAIEVDRERSLREGALGPWGRLNEDDPFTSAIDAVARWNGLTLDRPVKGLGPDSFRAILHGGDDWIEVPGAGYSVQFKGVFPALAEAARVSWVYRHRLSDLVGEVACSTCEGSRLKDYPSATRLAGRTIGEWMGLPLGECLAEITKLKLTTVQKKIAGELLREIRHRLQFLVDVGLDYLTLGRSTPTLSGGEAQRIRLASQLGSGLTGVLYLLDEPTIGLHPRDNGRLLKALAKLRDLGNTVILVEHDREVIAAADHLVDFGPGAGRFGGEIVAAGAPAKVAKDKNSLTGRYLSGGEAIPVPTNRRPTTGPALEIVGAAHHNLRGVDAKIPLGSFVAVTGVSGSGKSSLIVDILWAALARRLHRAQLSPGTHEEIRGLELIDKVINVDQQPIGNTPSSSPATYTGVFDPIRELFAHMPEAKVRGYAAGRFSFNRPGGRCEACEGVGQKKIEMHFLPDVWITCDVCRGKRYTPETLAITFKGKSIADVLEMSAGEALELFSSIPNVQRLLRTLCDVGLDYLALGQSAPTLSGGESQRVKLAAELARPNTGRTLYILDEPTTGLHFDDVKKLLAVLHRLVDLGNTVVVIEHNLDVIKTADWLIDMGPEAGDRGGRVVVAGTPEEVVGHGSKKRGVAEASHTGVALKPVLEAGPHAARTIAAVAEPVAPADEAAAIRKIAGEVKMPWEIDGPRWHCVERISRSGKPTKWEGDSLRHVVKLIEKSGAFGPVNWNDRSLVEIAPERKSDGWFFHALTGEEWLLRLKFRPARGAFKTELLNRQLGLASLNDLKEVPLYGDEPRVRVKFLRSHLQEVDISVYRASEIKTPAFAAFIEEAIASFTRTIDRTSSDPASTIPWSGEGGEEWHRSNKGFRPGRRVRWQREILGPILRAIEEASPQGTWDWSSRDSVKRRFRGVGPAWARIMTKNHRGLEVFLIGPKGRYNLAAIDRFGADQEIRGAAGHHDAIRFVFLTEDDVSTRPFIDFLETHLESFLSAFSKVGSQQQLFEA